jgi:hypothetical protein
VDRGQESGHDDDAGALVGEVHRVLGAYGRDVDVPQSQLGYDHATRRLSVVGGSRRDGKINEALVAVVKMLCGQDAALSKNAIEDEMKASERARDIVCDALKRGKKIGSILVEQGDRGAELHYVNPSARGSRGSSR